MRTTLLGVFLLVLGATGTAGDREAVGRDAQRKALALPALATKTFVVEISIAPWVVYLEMPEERERFASTLQRGREFARLLGDLGSAAGMMIGPLPPGPVHVWVHPDAASMRRTRSAFAFPPSDWPPEPPKPKAYAPKPAPPEPDEADAPAPPDEGLDARYERALRNTRRALEMERELREELRRLRERCGATEPPPADPGHGLVGPWQETGLCFVVCPSAESPLGPRPALRRAAEILFLEYGRHGLEQRTKAPAKRRNVPEGLTWLRYGTADLLARISVSGGRPAAPRKLSSTGYWLFEDLLAMRSRKDLDDRTRGGSTPSTRMEARARFAHWTGRLAYVLWSPVERWDDYRRALRADIAGDEPEAVLALLPDLSDPAARRRLESEVCPGWALQRLLGTNPVLGPRVGQVTGVDEDLNIVLISCGLDDGILTETRLVILRGGLPLAILTIDKVGPDWACGRIDRKSARDFPVKGENVLAIPK